MRFDPKIVNSLFDKLRYILQTDSKRIGDYFCSIKKSMSKLPIQKGNHKKNSLERSYETFYTNLHYVTK